MNFGKWIVVAFVLFAAFIATLVTVCVREDISLVSKEYYKEELAYQDQITRLNNTALIPEKPVISVVGQTLRIAFRHLDRLENGELKLFCPSNEKMDKRFQVLPTPDLTRSFGLGDLDKGMYRARLSWKMDGKEFYQEEVIQI